jgi:hypothetical protein
MELEENIFFTSYQSARLGIDSWAPYKVYKYGLRYTEFRRHGIPYFLFFHIFRIPCEIT